MSTGIAILRKGMDTYGHVTHVRPNDMTRTGPGPALFLHAPTYYEHKDKVTVKKKVDGNTPNGTYHLLLRRVDGNTPNGTPEGRGGGVRHWLFASGNLFYRNYIPRSTRARKGSTVQPCCGATEVREFWPVQLTLRNGSKGHPLLLGVRVSTARANNKTAHDARREVNTMARPVRKATRLRTCETSTPVSATQPKVACLVPFNYPCA